MISAFGCMNGMILAGARAYFAMALDGLFFRRAADLNDAKVPAAALRMQALWVAVLVLIRTYNPATNTYGNLYSNLLDYVISAALIFYILTIAGLFRLRRIRPDAPRPYRAWGYPVVPALYIVAASVILAILFLYRPATTNSRADNCADRCTGLFRLPRNRSEGVLMRVGIEASINSALLSGFKGLDIVRIPAEPEREIAVDFWVAAQAPASQRRLWPHLKGAMAVQGLWAGVRILYGR